MLQSCEHCGRQIGASEQAEFWKHHVVCSQCKLDLARSGAPVARPTREVPGRAAQVKVSAATTTPAAQGNADEVDWASVPVHEFRSQARPKPAADRAKFLIGGTVAAVVAVIGLLQWLDRSAHPEAQVVQTASPAPPASPAGTPAANIEKGDAKSDVVLMHDLQAAFDLEAAGKIPDATKAYDAVVESLSNRPTRTDAQIKLLARAHQATTRLSAKSNPTTNATAFPAKPRSLFSTDDQQFTSVTNPIEDAAPVPAGSSAGGVPARRNAFFNDSDSDDGALSAKPTGVDVQLAAGMKALSAGNYDAALRAFRDAVKADPRSILAMHGLGVTHFQMGENVKAISEMEDAASLGTDRALVHNLAVVYFKDTPLRGARFIQDYLSRPNIPLDEPLQNVVGVCLQAAAATDAREGVAFAEVREAYFRYDKQLASVRRDGKRRWGVKWVDAKEAETKWQQYLQRLNDADQLSRSLASSAVQTSRAQEQLDKLTAPAAGRTDQEIAAAKARLDDAKRAEQGFRTRYAQAKELLHKTEAPAFPKYLSLIPIDCLDPAGHPPQN